MLQKGLFLLMALKGTKPQERRCPGNGRQVSNATRMAFGLETSPRCNVRHDLGQVGSGVGCSEEA